MFDAKEKSYLMLEKYSFDKKHHWNEQGFKVCIFYLVGTTKTSDDKYTMGGSGEIWGLEINFQIIYKLVIQGHPQEKHKKISIILIFFLFFNEFPELIQFWH